MKSKILIHDVLEALQQTAEFDFQGDREEALGGLAMKMLRHNQTKFLMVLDNSWSKHMKRTYGQLGLKPEEVIVKAAGLGFTHFICPTSLRGNPALEGATAFFAERTLDFGLNLTRAVRELSRATPIIGVTGSAGKSTTCSMFGHVLSQLPEQPRTLIHRGNGFVNAMVNLCGAHKYDYAVLEASSRALHLLERKDFHLNPDVAVVTSIAESHMELLSTLEGVAEAKSGIFRSPSGGGHAVINADTPYADLLTDRAREAGRDVTLIGECAGADLRLLEYDAVQQLVTADITGQQVQYRIGAPGRHMALNSLAVLAALRQVPGIDSEQLLEGFASFSPLEGRGEAFDLPLKNGATIFVQDETYNANPASMRVALEVLSERKTTHANSRTVAVLGDMAEMGDQVEAAHHGLQKPIKDAAPDAVFLYGKSMKHLAASLPPERTRYEDTDLDAMAAMLLDELKDGDAVLFKASNSTGLKKLIELIQK